MGGSLGIAVLVWFSSEYCELWIQCGRFGWWWMLLIFRLHLPVSCQTQERNNKTIYMFLIYEKYYLTCDITYCESWWTDMSWTVTRRLFNFFKNIPYQSHMVGNTREIMKCKTTMSKNYRNYLPFPGFSPGITILLYILLYFRQKCP